MLYLDYAFGDSEEDEAWLESERLKCHLNLAAVFIELQNYTEAINHCRLALQIDPENSKAIFRRGVAYLRLDELEEAQKDLYRVLKIASSGDKGSLKTIEASVRELNLKWREYRTKSRSIASSALGIPR
jgi:tetratricopeptide (TPR) repeat protein